MNNISFKKLTHSCKEVVFSWLAEPHVQAFWDNSQAHKDDIVNFLNGRQTPSDYCDGKYVYWVAYLDETPYAMLMSIQETVADDIDELKRLHLSKIGHTYGLDYMIGSTEHLGKGYGALTLTQFMNFFRQACDPKADTFFIDPANDNTKAKRAFERAGFHCVGEFIMGSTCSGYGKGHLLLIKKFLPTVTLKTANLSDYPTIQSMARPYMQQLANACEHHFEDKASHGNTPSEYIDFKNYFEDDTREAYLVEVYNQVAGFVLLNQAVTNTDSDWNIGEFFILRKYQGQGIGKIAAEKTWQLHPGKWEVSVIPENIAALKFWDHTLHQFTDNNFKREIKLVSFDSVQPKRMIYSFNSKSNK